jgi:hypothetical protein
VRSRPSTCDLRSRPRCKRLRREGRSRGAPPWASRRHPQQRAEFRRRRSRSSSHSSKEPMLTAISPPVINFSLTANTPDRPCRTTRPRTKRTGWLGRFVSPRGSATRPAKVAVSSGASRSVASRNGAGLRSFGGPSARGLSCTGSPLANRDCRPALRTVAGEIHPSAFVSHRPLIERAAERMSLTKTRAASKVRLGS